jgi:predicted AAA+ superfamily ATPase
MYSRHIEPALAAALSDSPVVFLNGARQTGKSTLTQSLSSGRRPARYLTFDDLGVLSAAKSDPQAFLAGLQGPVILDEIQRAPELFLPLKADVDRNREPGRYLLTGSANALVLPKLSEALAGRMEILTLWPLSQGEIGAVKDDFIDAVFAPHAPEPSRSPSLRNELWERVVRGGYPEPLGRALAERRRAWADSYLATIIERDVRDIANIEGLTQLPRLLNLLATRTAAQLNFAELSRSMGLPQTTLKRYLALLEATFLIRRLPPWSGNLGKRLVKSPKIFLNDTGLAASVLALDAARLAADGNLAGPLLENFVVAELTKQIGWSKTKPRMYYFRTLAGEEVDVVLEDARGRCVGIEIKAGSVDAKDFKGLKALGQALGDKFLRGLILSPGQSPVSFAGNMTAMDLNALWAPTR